MNYADLRAAVYAHAGELLEDFMRSSSEGAVLGALVFFPDGYRDADDFSEVHYAFYSHEQLARELFDGQLPGAMAEILNPFAQGEECAVCIIEDPDGTGRNPIHVHRVTRFFAN